jgi:site-specific DNA recombinase
VGEVYANRTRATPSARRQSALHPVGKTGTTNLLTARGDWIAVADVPAIVTRGQFDAAQERLTRNRQLASRNNTVHPYLLRGLVSCGYCRRGCSGRHMAPAHDYYLCRTKIAMRELVGEERCQARYIPARALEALVWGDLCTVLANPDMIAEALERARNGHWLPQELQARKMTLRQGHASVAQQIDRLTDAYLGGVLTLTEYERRRRELEGRLRALERQERELARDAANRNEVARLAAHSEDFCRRVRGGLAALTFEQKRSLLELLIDRVVVTDEAVEIRYVFPTSRAGETEAFCQLRTDDLGPVDIQRRAKTVPARWIMAA